MPTAAFKTWALAAVVLTGASAASSEFTDFTDSVIRLPAGISARTVSAVDARLDAVRRHAGAPGLLRLLPALEAGAGPAAAAEVRVEWGATTAAGSFVLAADGAAAVLTARRGDEQALLGGIGRLCRELRVDRRSGTARLPRQLHCESGGALAALWPLRGHQVSTAHYPSSLRTWPAFREYVADLAVFGTNQIELAHTGGSQAALVNFSAAVDAVGGVNVSL